MTVAPPIVGNESEVVHSWALAPAGSADPEEAGNRPTLSYSAEPGTVVEDRVTLFNFGNVPLTFRVYATDAFNNDSGAFDILPGSERPTDVGSWVRIPQEYVQVPPGQQVTMPISIAVPADAEPGDHAGAVVAASEARSTGATGEEITLERRTGTRIYLRVAGPLRPELAVEGLASVYRPAVNPVDGTTEVRYRVVNRGNVRLGARSNLTVTGPFGLAERRLPALEIAELLPGESVEVTREVDGVPALVLARTTVELEPTSVGGALDAPVSRRRTTAFAPPVTVVLTVLLALFSGLAWRARRRHQRLAALATTPTSSRP